jgi:microcystin-dependent protein
VGEPYLGEIKMVGWNFAARGWAFTNGQLLPINQNQALFALLGTMYGGNGQTNFALPNMQSRMPMHQGQGVQLTSRTVGQVGGVEAATFPVGQIPGNPVEPIQALGVPSSAITTLSPFLVISFLIALQGVFPARN